MIFNFILAFFAGFISFLSPCVLPLIPGYISYISGQSLNDLIEKKEPVIKKTIFFSIGFSIIFIIFGATASFLGKLLIQYSGQLRIVAGIIIITFSAQLLGIINLTFLNVEKKYYTKNYHHNTIFPLIVGAAFGFGWSPCIGPVLGSILVLAAVEKTIYQSIFLLSFYSLGLAIPFVLFGYAIQKSLTISKILKKKLYLINKISGSILLLTGLLILTNQLQFLGFYIIKAIPILSRLG